MMLITIEVASYQMINVAQNTQQQLASTNFFINQQKNVT